MSSLTSAFSDPALGREPCALGSSLKTQSCYSGRSSLGREIASQFPAGADTAISRIHASIERLFGQSIKDLLLLAPQERMRLLEQRASGRDLHSIFLSYALLLREEGLCQLLRGSQICAMECFLLSMEVFVRISRMGPNAQQGLSENA